MSSHRHRFSHHQPTWRRRVKQFFRGKWLSAWFIALQRVRVRWQRNLRKLLAPRWLRKTSDSLQARVRKAESKVARVRKSILRKIARSTVGWTARQVARRSRILELRCAGLLKKGVLGLSALAPEPVRRFFRAVGRAFWHMCSVLFVFVARWCRTRQYWHLAGGIPAFLLALPLAYCMVRMPFYGNAAKAKHYRSAALAALDSKDYETADLYFRKLYQLGAMNEMSEYQSAVNAYESGNVPEAVQQMEKLGPKDQPGFPAAHIWLAHRFLYLTGDRSDLPPEELKRLEGLATYLTGGPHLTEEQAKCFNERAMQHLMHALDRDPRNPVARSLRAKYLTREGRNDEALTELQEVVKQLPQQGLELAQLYARQGRWDDARAAVQKVLDHYANKENTRLESVEYRIWSVAWLIMNDVAKAEAVLERGLVEYPGDPTLTEQLRALCVAQSDTLQGQRINPQEQLRLLVRACQLKPNDQEAIVRLSERAQDAGATGHQARQAILDLLQQNQAPQLLYAIVGTQAAERGDYETAAKHLRIACQKDPQDAQSLNNLAWALLQMGEGHYDEGLSIASKALSIKPQEPMYRETRGQLLLRMGRYKQAVDDLEYALNGLADSTELHRLLAQAYEQLGQSELAQAHRRSAGAGGKP